MSLRRLLKNLVIGRKRDEVIWVDTSIYSAPNFTFRSVVILQDMPPIEVDTFNNAESALSIFKPDGVRSI